MVEFTAHRGESRDAPENTLAAFRLAWTRRVRSVELDVHLSRDGVLVVHHDRDTERMTGQKRIIRDLDFVELADLHHRDGGPIPRLDDVLREMPADGRILVEIKSGPESVEPLARCLVATGATPGQVQVICFEAEVLVEVRRRLPELTVQFLAEFVPDRADVWREDVCRWIDLARSSGFHGLGLDRRIPLDRRAVEDVHNSGLGLHIWTVDDLERARELVGLGISAITSNRAAWLRDHLGERMVNEAGSG